jgi:hypothetical protein
MGSIPPCVSTGSLWRIERAGWWLLDDCPERAAHIDRYIKGPPIGRALLLGSSRIYDANQPNSARSKSRRVPLTLAP